MNLDRHLLFLQMVAAAALLGTACTPVNDDDDAAANDDDVANDDDLANDDDSSENMLTVAGEVTVVDRDSGEILTDYAYAERGGPMIVYLTTDPTNLSDPLAKFTLLGPGSWSTRLPGDGTQIFVMVIVDDNGNRIIEQTDMLREHGQNPRLLDQSDLLDLDVVVDLPSPDGGGGGNGGGGNGDDDDAAGGGDDDDAVSDDDDAAGDDDDQDGCTTIDGTTVLLAGSTGEIVVTANSADLGVGPIVQEYQSAAGAFSICVPDDGQYTALLGIQDTDGNGFFEPDDEIGTAQINPIALGIGDVIGAVIEIPSAVPVSLPVPPPYVYLEGDVAFPSYTTGDILVFASVDDTIYYSQVLPAPGGFSLRAPPNTEDVQVWAAVDEDSDGSFDVVTDPVGYANLLSTVTFDVQGLLVNIVDPYDNSISGTANWGGLVSSGDALQIALLSEPGGGSAPAANLTIIDPVFPQAWTVPELLSGTYYVTGYLDAGADGDGAGPNEPIGLYSNSQGMLIPVVLGGEAHPVGVDFSLEVQVPPAP